MLLADNDPLSLRVPIVGVWISGGGAAGAVAAGRQRHPGRRSSPLAHPLAYPACLRFLLGFRGGVTAGVSTKAAAAASPAAFLLLHLTGGVGGGAPTCFEGCALDPSGGCGSAAAEPAADGKGGARVSPFGFELLDFSADVDVTVGGKDAGIGGREDGGGGGSRNANRPVVIGRLRRVSNLSAAGGAFGRALARARGRWARRTKLR